MQCRQCGTEIADKAIVCYRCGTPTAAPVVESRREPTRRRPNWAAIPILLLIIALGVWLIPKTPADTTARWLAWAALVIAAGGTVTLLRRRRGPRLR